METGREVAISYTISKDVAAQMTLVIVLTRPAALGQSSASFHEPFHADGKV